MGETSIEWCHRQGTVAKTWNPIQGCQRISEGCRHCYAESIARRFAQSGWSQGLINIKTGKWSGDTRVAAHKLDEPLHWKKPCTVFVNSMSDLFYEGFSNEQIAAVFGVMAACPQHTFIILTKRAKRMREWFKWLDDRVESEAEAWSGRDCTTSIHDARRDSLLEYLDETACAAMAVHFDCCHLGITTNPARVWPLANVWLGVSVENQEAADERIPELLATPAAVRLLSCEPLIGEVDLDPPLCDDFDRHGRSGYCVADDDATPWCAECDEERSYGHWLHLDGGIDWVIAGCESGNGSRPCEVQWLRSLRDQCDDAGVPFFLKQAERSAAITHGYGSGWKKKRTGGDHIVTAPYLDGVQHIDFPKAA